MILGDTRKEDDGTKLEITLAINKRITLERVKIFVYLRTTITEKADERKKLRLEC